MSMLTPPGMGGKYRITGDVYPRMRRPRRRHRLVLASAAAVAVVGVGGWGTLQLIDVFSGGGTASASGKPGRGAGAGCDGTAEAKGTGRNPAAHTAGGAAAGKLPKPGSITVNVLNATDRSGLAKTTSDELKKRGFHIGDVANAPADLDGKVKGAGVLVGAPGAGTADRMKVLGTQLGGADTRYDDRKDHDVDLVIGDRFEKLAEKGKAQAALDALASPSPKPSHHCAK